MNMKQRIKHLIKNALARLGYEISRISAARESEGFILNAYHAAILSLLSRKNSLTIVVVGANDGKTNDPIYELIKEYLCDHSELILIEPQAELLPYLDDNYRMHKNRHIFNYAIGQDSTLNLYKIKEKYWDQLQPPYADGWPIYRAPTGVTSTQESVVLDWLRRYFPKLKDSATLVERIAVPCTNLPDLLRQKSLSVEIDVLQIDVEGADDDVIYRCDIETTNPAIIFYETKHIPDQRARLLSKHLSSSGYITFTHGDNALAIRQKPLRRDANDMARDHAASTCG